MRKLILDIDGVVLDSISIICHVLSDRDYVFYDPSKVLKWNMEDVIQNTTSQEITSLFESYAFWSLADSYIMDGAKEFIEKYKDKIIFCSIGGITNQIHKLAWIKRNFGDIDCIPIVTNMDIHPKSIDKTYVNMGNGDIYIEDSYSNLEQSYAEYKILFNNFGNWNSEWSFNKKLQDNACYDDRATNWDEVRKYVERYIAEMDEFEIA